MTTVQTGAFQFGRAFSNGFSAMGGVLPTALPTLVLFTLAPQIAVGVLHATVLPVDRTNTFVAVFGAYGETIVANLLSLGSSAGVIHAVGNYLAGSPASARQVLAASARKFLPLWGVGIASGVAVGAASLLFLVPGLMLLTAWFVARPVVVLENEDIFGSLSRSVELTKGHRWPVFGFILLYGLILFVGLMILSLIGLALGVQVMTLVITPVSQVIIVFVSAALSTGLFHELKRSKQGAVQVADIFS